MPARHRSRRYRDLWHPTRTERSRRTRICIASLRRGDENGASMGTESTSDSNTAAAEGLAVPAVVPADVLNYARPITLDYADPIADRPANCRVLYTELDDGVRFDD